MNKNKFNPASLYVYFINILLLLTLFILLLVKIQLPALVIIFLILLIGPIAFIPVVNRLSQISQNFDHFQNGKALLDSRKQWPDPLYPLLLQIQQLGNHDQNVANLREGWKAQIAQAAAQEERNRLARELHDSIKQQLFSIQMSAAAIQQRWESDPDGARAALADLRQSAQEGLAEMNALLLQLSPAPLERVGLTQAIQELCQALGYRSAAQVNCQIGELPADERLSSGWQESIFRIVQEGLSNIARHARASYVNLSLQQDTSSQQLILKIEDDGKGYQPSTTKPGQGLRGILERAEALGGQAQIKAMPNQGVNLQVTLPLLSPVEMEEQDLVADNRANKIAWISLLGGVLSAATLTPIVLAQVGGYLSESSNSALWLWLIPAVLFITLTGWLAGRFIPAADRSVQILQSAISAAGAAIIAYGLVLVVPVALQGMDALLRHGLHPASELQTSILIIDSALGIFSWTHAAFWILMLVGAGLGAIGGLVAGTRRVNENLKSRISMDAILSMLLAGSACTYLFGTLVLPIMEAAMLENAMKSGALRELFYLPHSAPFLVLTTPLIILLFSLAFNFQKITQEIKTGTLQILEQAHWKSFNLAVLSFGIAIISSLLGWVTTEEIPTTSTVFILGAALLLLTNAVLFLRLTVRSRRKLSEGMQPGWLWLAYATPVLVILLPGVLLATITEVFTTWVLVLYLMIVLGFVVAYSLLSQTAKPAGRLSMIRQQAAQLNQNWLAAAFSLVIPALPMGSAGLAILSVVIPFVNPLDSERLPGWISSGDTISSLLREDFLMWQPAGFLILLVVAVVLVGLWAFFTHLRILNAQRHQ